MNNAEVSKLLTIDSLVTNRAISPELVQVWQGLLDDVPYQDAVDALKEHYRTSTKWLMPANIRDLCTTAARERRQAPQRALAHRRQWLLDNGIDYLEWERGEPHAIETARSLARDNPNAPEGITTGEAIAI